MSSGIDYGTRLEIYEKFFYVLNDTIATIRKAINSIYSGEYVDAVKSLNDAVTVINRVIGDLNSIATGYVTSEQEEEEKVEKEECGEEQQQFRKEEEKESKEVLIEKEDSTTITENDTKPTKVSTKTKKRKKQEST